MSSFCANILWPKKLLSQTVIRKKLSEALSYKKFARKMLMKLTPMVNFINNSQVQKEKKLQKSTFVRKGAPKMLMKLTTGRLTGPHCISCSEF